MTVMTALVIFPPHTVQAIAVPIMRQYAANTFLRICGHMTLLVPFVPFEEAEQTAETLHRVCAGIKPFEVTLSGYGHFPKVAFMQPADPQPIKALFRKVFDAFPLYPPYGGAFGSDLHPHLTVAEFATEDELRTTWLPDYAPLTFTVDRIHLIYGTEDPLPWLTYSAVPLGG